MAASANAGIDASADFVPVSTMSTSPMFLVVNPSLPVHDVRGLVERAKAMPDAMNYASSGNGTTPHLYAELFKLRTATHVVHVPYKGTAPALSALIAGDVQMGFAPATSVLAFVKAGKLRALATTGRQRDPQLPELPTVEEAGVPGFETGVWFGLSVPAGTPKPVIARLNAETVKGAHAPDFVATMTKLGYDITVSTPEQMAETLREEIHVWAPIVKASGAKLD
jgi:tripartite-type tricarboxylate transporter receptor subunit TctC